MKGSRKVELALGVAAGSLAWSLAAALGLAPVMTTSAWAFEAMRYLSFLAFKSACSAIRTRTTQRRPCCS